MRRFVSTMTVLAGLAVMAAPALAQTGQDRERPDFERRGMRGAGPAAMMRAPGAMLLEKRAELGLTAEQVSQIEAIQDRVRAANAPRLEQLRAALGERPARDRTRRDMTAEERQARRDMTAEERQARRDMTQEERQARRDQMRARSEQMRPLMQEIREANRAAGEQIQAVLTAKQQEQVRELRRAAREEWQSRRGVRHDGAREGRRPHRGQRGPGR